MIRNNLYHGDDFARLKNINLYLDGGTTVEHLKMDVEIMFKKGAVRDQGDNRVRMMGALNNPRLNFIDVVLIFVAHCLRHKLFLDGFNLDEVLDKASRRADKSIRWRDPRLRVIPKLDHSSRARLHEVATDGGKELLLSALEPSKCTSRLCLRCQWVLIFHILPVIVW
jgi:hypothetical protein